MSEKQSEVTGRLENWDVDPLGRRVVWGNLYEDVHKRWKDGQYIHTSGIPNGVTDLKEGMVIQTLNSKYLLGKRLKNNS